MKVIFSRKGFDSSAGGCPSPLVNGHPVSLPIPTSMPSSSCFNDLPGDMPAIVTELTRGRIQGSDPCHLDPDLNHAAAKRLPGWRGSLGQVSAAQSHLANNEVGPADLFLFWGLYQPACKNGHWSFTGDKEHRLFGWLQIDQVIHVGSDPHAALDQYPWLAGHPHLHEGWSHSNTVYIARDTLALPGLGKDLLGWGLFNEGLRLTAEGSRLPSVWSVPAWLNPTQGGVGMTYHPDSRWSSNGTLKSAARGQEFIADIADRDYALNWLTTLFKELP